MTTPETPAPTATVAPSDQKLIPTVHVLDHSQAFRILWALEELSSVHGIKYNFKTYRREKNHAHSELKHIYPIGKSPILTLETTDGSPPPTIQLKPGVLVESRLIMHFLNDEYGKGMWTPESEEDRRRDIYFQEYAGASFIHRVDFAMLFEVITIALPFGLRHLFSLLVLPIVSYFKAGLLGFYQLMEDSLTEEKPWFSGKKIGIADFSMSFGMEMADQRGYFDRTKFPKLAGWYERITGLESYRSALKKAGDYDLKTFGVK